MNRIVAVLLFIVLTTVGLPAFATTRPEPSHEDTYPTSSLQTYLDHSGKDISLEEYIKFMNSLGLDVHFTQQYLVPKINAGDGELLGNEMSVIAEYTGVNTLPDKNSLVFPQGQYYPPHIFTQTSVTQGWGTRPYSQHSGLFEALTQECAILVVGALSHPVVAFISSLGAGLGNPVTFGNTFSTITHRYTNHNGWYEIPDTYGWQLYVVTEYRQTDAQYDVKISNKSDPYGPWTSGSSDPFIGIRQEYSLYWGQHAEAIDHAYQRRDYGWGVGVFPASSGTVHDTPHQLPPLP